MSAIAHRHTAFVSSAFARAPSDDARVRRQLACSAPTARVSRLSRGFSSRAPRARPATDTTASTSSARVIWFRIGDLRTHDHPALTAAASDPSTPVLPVFVFDPAEARHMTPGALRAAHESVSDLRANLRAAGLDLIVRIGDPIAILPGARSVRRRRVHRRRRRARVVPSARRGMGGGGMGRQMGA